MIAIAASKQRNPPSNHCFNLSPSRAPPAAIVVLDSQDPSTGKKKKLDKVLDFACGSLLLNVRKQLGPHGIGKIYGKEKNITTYNLARMNILLHGVKDLEFEICHGDK